MASYSARLQIAVYIKQSMSVKLIECVSKRCSEYGEAEFLGGLHCWQCSQSSMNGVGLTKPLNTSLNTISKYSGHLRKPNKGGRGRGRGEVGITGYQPNIDAW